MTASTFRSLCLVPAKYLLEQPRLIPNEEGVYLVFLAGGRELLRAASYFKYGSLEPVTRHGSAHIYTGSSLRMRTRVQIHLRGGANHSGLRKTLIAVQLARRAISKTRTPGCAVSDRAGLSNWLALNASIAFVPCNYSRSHESHLLGRLASPLNIINQRTPGYADQLLRWRQEFYPRTNSF